MAPPSPTICISAYLFPAAMNSEPNEAMSRNHCESSMSQATPPATARSRNPSAITAMSMTGSSLSAME